MLYHVVVTHHISWRGYRDFACHYQQMSLEFQTMRRNRMRKSGVGFPSSFFSPAFTIISSVSPKFLPVSFLYLLHFSPAALPLVSRIIWSSSWNQVKHLYDKIRLNRKFSTFSREKFIENKCDCQFCQQFKFL